jgi:hypothetical protein
MKLRDTSVRLTALVLLIGAVFAGAAFALDLDRQELEDALGADIEFENYEGPVDRIDSRDAIRAIGRSLGSQVRASESGDYDGRYLITRIEGDPEERRLAADIIELGRAARVDHITNLRRIVAGYLEGAWDYGEPDANLLARFITIYNAVNRGAMEVVEERYRSAVAAFADPPRIGLATSYRRWPGETQLIIPLSEGRSPGDLDAVQPRQLVDARVIDELRTRADLGIEDRKAIIDFIERVIEERTALIQEEREALEEEQAAIDQRQAELDAEEEDPQPQAAEPSAAPAPQADEDDEPEAEDDELDREDPPAAAADADAEDEPSTEADTADEEPAAADQDEAAAPAPEATPQEEEREELAQREAEIAERQEELDQEEEEVEELTERVEELYEETAEDQEELAEAPAPREFVPFVLGAAGGDFELAVVDFQNAELAGEQTIPLASQETVPFQGGVLVAHRDSGRLLLLDPTSLEVLAEGDAEVVPGSRIVTVGTSILTIIPYEGAHRIGEFDAQLVLQRLSAEPVSPLTDLVIRDDRVLVQGQNGRLRTLVLP